jgi:hypothetical protein
MTTPNTVSLGGVLRANIPNLTFSADQQGFIATGWANFGDEHAGALYVRSTGPSDGLMPIQAGDGSWWKIVVVNNTIPAGHTGMLSPWLQQNAGQNSDAIDAAMIYLHGIGGGIVQLPQTTIYVSRTIENKYDNVIVQGVGTDYPHEPSVAAAAAIEKTGTTILPTGAFTVLLHRSQTAAERGVPVSEAYKCMGGGFKYLRVLGNNVSPRLLEVLSVNNGVYHLFLKDALGYECAVFDCQDDTRSGNTTTGLGEAGDNQFLDINLTIWQEASQANTQNVHGVRFAGFYGAGNTSLVDKIDLNIWTWSGVGVLFEYCDNLVINSLNHQAQGGTGRPFYAAAGANGVNNYGLRIRRLSAFNKGYVEGTWDRQGATVPGQITIDVLDVGNGTQPPDKGNDGQFWYGDYNHVQGWNDGFAHWQLGQRGKVNNDVNDNAMTLTCVDTGKMFIFRTNGQLQLPNGTVLG